MCRNVVVMFTSANPFLHGSQAMHPSNQLGVAAMKPEGLDAAAGIADRYPSRFILPPNERSGPRHRSDPSEQRGSLLDGGVGTAPIGHRDAEPLEDLVGPRQHLVGFCPRRVIIGKLGLRR